VSRQGNNRRRGFTLIEAMVAALLVSIGVVAVFGGIAALNRAEARSRDADLLQSLTLQKMNEMGAVNDPRTADTSGDFSDRGYPDVTWEIDVEPSGAQDVDKITVTATRGQAEQKLTQMLYVPADTTAGANAAGGTGQ
jgi:Tfp pilus assembly protein PilV